MKSIDNSPACRMRQLDLELFARLRKLERAYDHCEIEGRAADASLFDEILEIERFFSDTRATTISEVAAKLTWATSSQVFKEIEETLEGKALLDCARFLRQMHS